MTSASPQLVGYPGESLAPVEPPVAPRVLVPLAAVPAPAPAPAPEQALGAGDLLTIAEGLATIAPRWAGMQRPRRRVWDLMAASESFEAWVIGWPTGARIDLHDHGPSAGAVVVASGELRETTPVEDGTGVGSWLTRVVTAGESVTFGPNYVHGLVNAGASVAVSVHVYSPRLTSMTYFDLVDGRLRTVP